MAPLTRSRQTEPETLEQVEAAILRQLAPGRPASMDQVASEVGLSVPLTVVRRAIWDLLDKGKLTLTTNFYLTKP